jgi:hypothetical protein
MEERDLLLQRKDYEPWNKVVMTEVSKIVNLGYYMVRICRIC